MSASVEAPVVVIGAGPAGLTAAYDLTRRGVPTIVFDRDLQVVGLAKTVVYKGFRFDIGGHRFFTKVSAVRELWRELLGEDLLRVGAEWAAQRIKGLSLWTAVRSMLRRNGNGQIRTVVHEFEYPRLGPGMMWETCRDRIEACGGRVRLDMPVLAIQHNGRRVTSVVAGTDGNRCVQPASHVISAMPVRHLVSRMRPSAPCRPGHGPTVEYRDFLTAALIVDAPSVLPDNWIYIHDPAVRVGRVQNFKNWSPDMVPDPRLPCLGLEYFSAARRPQRHATGTTTRTIRC